MEADNCIATIRLRWQLRKCHKFGDLANGGLPGMGWKPAFYRDQVSETSEYPTLNMDWGRPIPVQVIAGSGSVFP